MGEVTGLVVTHRMVWVVPHTVSCSLESVPTLLISSDWLSSYEKTNQNQMIGQSGGWWVVWLWGQCSTKLKM